MLASGIRLSHKHGFASVGVGDIQLAAGGQRQVFRDGALVIARLSRVDDRAVISAVDGDGHVLRDHATIAVTVTVDDGNGGVVSKDVTVTINGTDDGAIINPAQPGDDKGTVTEDLALTTGGKLDVTDPDAGEAVFQVQTNAAGQHGTFSIDADGKWTYNLTNNDPAVQGLARARR